MATYRGKVSRSDLEGGFWELVTDSGDHFQLRGGDDALRVEGQSVVVEGRVDKGGFGIGMSGPILDVSSWKAG